MVMEVDSNKGNVITLYTFKVDLMLDIIVDLEVLMMVL